MNPQPKNSTTPPCHTCPIHHQRQTTPPGTKATYQRKFDIATELEIVCAYCHHQPNPQSTPQIAKDKACTQDTIQNILRRYDKPPRTLSDAQRLRRGSPTLTFPLSIEVHQLLTNPKTRSFFPHLIAIMLLTDGGAGYRKTDIPYIKFTNKAESLHNIFADLIYYAYHQPPSAFLRPYWSKAGKRGSRAYYTSYNRRNETENMLQNLYRLSQTYRTRPKRMQTWEKYLQEKPQPTIQFLLRGKLPKPISIFATRLTMSAEGTVSPMFRHDSQYPYPHFTFSCKHPLLQKQWQSFFEQQGICLDIRKEMLESGKLETAHRFLELGGFFKGVQMRTNSYYYDIDRQDVLKAIFTNRENYPIDPQLSLEQKHALLRKKALILAQEE